MTATAIKQMDSTSAMVRNCETLSEDAVRFLTENGVGFDNVGFDAVGIGFICRKAFYDALVDVEDNSEIAPETDWMNIFNTEFEQQILPDYVFMSIHPEVYNYLMDEEVIDEFEEKRTVDGIVKFDDFMKGLRSLGFDDYFITSNGTKIHNFQECMKEIKRNGTTEIGFYIKGDLYKDYEDDSENNNNSSFHM